MTDKEKVLRGWDRCSKCLYPSMFDQQFKDCEYTMGMYCRKDKLISETVELLKEQEAEWIEYPECLAYDGAYSDSFIVCSACEHVFNIMDNCTEEFDYCPHCGANMKLQCLKN